MIELKDHKHKPMNVTGGVILGIGLQTFAIIWWASSISFKLDELESKAESLVTMVAVEAMIEKKAHLYVKEDDQRHTVMASRMAVTETNFRHMLDSLQRIEKALDTK